MKIFIPLFDASVYDLAASIRDELQSLNVTVIYGDKNLKLGAQLRGAVREGFKWCFIVGHQELNSGNVSIKNLTDGTDVKISRSEIPAWIDNHK